jgi:hypothetical protein
MIHTDEAKFRLLREARDQPITVARDVAVVRRPLPA